MEAYSRHHELVLRPDDVWQAILTQFSFYVNANAEALRDRLVNFEGKMTLVVEMAGTLFTADYAEFAERMVDENIVQNIKDPEMVAWLMPGFSTTTVNDRVVAAVSVMSTLQNYFEYVCRLCCGIPKVTLLGTVEDWMQLQKKADRLRDFDLTDRRMSQWLAMLSPVLDQFVASASGKADLDFWDKVCCHLGGGSGPSYLSGWVTVFAVFNKDGEWKGDVAEASNPTGAWPQIDTGRIPAGTLSVPVLVDDNGTQYDTQMVAGNGVLLCCSLQANWLRTFAATDTVYAHAYNRHHELVLRPDDVWQAILTQFSFYVNANAEALRDRLVNFEGKMTLVVKMAGTLFTADYAEFAERMVDENIVQNIKDPEMVAWLMPGFSTTTVNDRVVAAVSVMSTLQNYFEYVCCLMCGIPKVTLLGTVEDWMQLQQKADRLRDFDLTDRRMSQWLTMLAPVLDQFVASASGKADLDFWDKVCCHLGGGSGPSYLSGWVTVFAVFNKDGKWQGDVAEEPNPTGAWPCIETGHIPAGTLSVPVLVDDHGTQYDTQMVAGHQAMDNLGKTDGCVEVHAPVLYRHARTSKAQTALHIAQEMVPGVDVKVTSQGGLQLVEIKGIGRKAGDAPLSPPGGSSGSSTLRAALPPGTLSNAPEQLRSDLRGDLGHFSAMQGVRAEAEVGGDCISIQGCEGPDHALRLRKELEAICGYYGFPAPQWG
ncbi:unnamed protein product [Symbiodinium necroappetens]|uniref:Uncharacterized protein n=1 Tax=Symbiodinium necroappetens TaxID=1628268 RepID=A0A813BVV1_9DINO|nr:unnamed protein product [Symbiodinium necroappetens]